MFIKKIALPHYHPNELMGQAYETTEMADMEVHPDMDEDEFSSALPRNGESSTKVQRKISIDGFSDEELH